MLRTADSDAPVTAGRKPSVLVHAVVRHDVEGTQWSPADRRSFVWDLPALSLIATIVVTR